ncbi:MAG TPA: amino acid permease [Pyrinomonadaceae bacterium]|nr:amino acid permease [Pyrinomonadaceae bacterium]
MSSTAYATEEILLVLAVAAVYGQAGAFKYVVPVSIGIGVLLVIVAISYRQTIHAYPFGGGAYIVAKENLGTKAGLVAGASLLVDYVLTVAVSIAAGVAAITSMAQGTRYAWLDQHKVVLCLIFIGFMFTGPMAWFYYVVQVATALILVLAANTSFADFPRLASLLARDRFLPRQFATRGDKLVFSNGIVILAIFASVLTIAFGGDTSRLIPLYAVGVFLSFTLSQSGMVRHWLKDRPTKKNGQRRKDDIHYTQSTIDSETLPDVELNNSREASFVTDEVTDPSHWLKSMVVNAVGALATFIVLCAFIATKFIHGAWIVVVVVPLWLFMFRAIHSHYVGVARQLSTGGLDELRPIKHTVIVPIFGIHRGVITALQYAKSIAPGHVQAVYVDFAEEATAKLREKWERWGAGINLVVLPSPYRELTKPLLRYIARLERRNHNDVVTVLLPEFVPAKWWQHLLHNQSSLMLKGALLFKERVIVISVPYHLRG